MEAALVGFDLGNLKMIILRDRRAGICIPAILGRCSYRGYQIKSKCAEAFQVVKDTKW